MKSLTASWMFILKMVEGRKKAACSENVSEHAAAFIYLFNAVGYGYLCRYADLTRLNG